MAYLLLVLGQMKLIGPKNSGQSPGAQVTTYNPHHILTVPRRQHVVLVGGCFDILHYGHVQFLSLAKAAGTYLVVALEPDSRILKYKGRPPIHSQGQRAENLAALRCVDQVVLLPELLDFDGYNALVQWVQPQIIAITAGDPQTDNKQRQAAAVNAVVQVVTPQLGTLSSSQILETY